MTAPITTHFALVILLLIVLLAFNTSRQRIRHRGSKDPAAAEAIRRASRTHGNNFEHGVVVILLMLFCELNGAGTALLVGAGAAYLVARAIYSYGYLTAPARRAMFIGASATYAIEAMLIVLLGFRLLQN